MAVRYHVSPNREGMGIFGYGYGCSYEENCGMEPCRSHACGSCCCCAMGCYWAGNAPSWGDPALRSRKSVCKPGIPIFAAPARVFAKHEPKRKLLGQCTHGKLL